PPQAPRAPRCPRPPAATPAQFSEIPSHSPKPCPPTPEHSQMQTLRRNRSRWKQKTPPHELPLAPKPPQLPSTRPPAPMFCARLTAAVSKISAITPPAITRHAPIIVSTKILAIKNKADLPPHATTSRHRAYHIPAHKPPNHRRTPRVLKANLRR